MGLIVLIGAISLLLLGFGALSGGAFIAGRLLREAISRQPWDFETAQEVYTEIELNHKVNERGGYLFDQTVIDLQPCPAEIIEPCAAKIEVQAIWRGFLIVMTLEQRPSPPHHFQVTHLYGLPLTFFPANIIGRNLSQGLNAGFDAALEQAGFEITGLTMRRDDIAFAADDIFELDTIWLDMKRTDRGELSEPAAGPSGPLDGKIMRLTVFNRSDLALILKLGEPTIIQTEMAAHDRWEIKTRPGVYTYTISAMDGTLLLQERITVTRRTTRLDIIQ